MDRQLRLESFLKVILVDFCLRSESGKYFDTCDLICLFLCYAQLSKLATQSEVRNAQPSTSLYHYSGQKPKNIFFHILVQTKTSLRPFPILPTFREYKFAMGTIFLHKHKCIQITA